MDWLQELLAWIQANEQQRQQQAPPNGQQPMPGPQSKAAIPQRPMQVSTPAVAPPSSPAPGPVPQPYQPTTPQSAVFGERAMQDQMSNWMGRGQNMGGKR